MHLTSPPRVAVITPYYRETTWQLARCMESVAAQQFACTQFLVADGYPNPVVVDWPVRHVQLDKGHADYGDTPRGIGSLLAVREGFDAVAYLDADNYYRPEHIALLVNAWEAHQRQLDVITTLRFFIYPDGRQMAVGESLTAGNVADTNCLFLAGRALAYVQAWCQMPALFHAFGDRIFWQMLQARGMRTLRLPTTTVAYTSNWKSHYLAMGETPPPDAKDIGDDAILAAQWWQGLVAEDRQHHLDMLGFDPGPAFMAVLSNAQTGTQPH